MSRRPDDDVASSKVRLDKWLWAARFFKTRALALAAIDGGKVHCDGFRAKAARDVKLEMSLRITREDGEWEVVVKGISAQRRGAPEAALLYEETAEGRARRELVAEQKKAEFGIRDHGLGRPTKRQLRDIKRFTGNW
ncbi:heat shock protein 15 [mine drainage metagenome]|uniref:Heat shock protein 15 n=1 Tax=mine drainage metagenome TaxID=410659 RepID=A0A1J5QI30_9ZZZZ